MLPMLKREVVEKYGWQDEQELLNVFAIGQSTPGIIAINVATYVGTRQRGLLGAIAATSGMVVPSLVIITVIATFFERFKENEYVYKAFSGIRVAVCAMLVVIVVGLARKAVTDNAGWVIMLGAFTLSVIVQMPIYMVVFCGGLSGVLFYSIRARAKSDRAPVVGPEEK